MTAEREILAYRRNYRARRVSGTRVLHSGLYFSNEDWPVYLSQGQLFPYGSGGVPLTWSLSAGPIGAR